MPKTEHTPGPWEIGSVVSSRKPPHLIAGEPLRVWASDKAGVADICLRRSLGASTAPTEEANARLIAAAPGLLAALEAIIAESRRIVRSDDDKRLYNIDKLATAALAAAQKAG